MSVSSRRVVVVCPSNPKPSGGVRKMYRHVDVLNANGIPAVILHHEVGFRCTWFANQTAVTYPPDAWPPKRSEVLLIPELFIWQFVGQAPDTPKVVFNQNAYQTFRGQSIAHQVSPYGMPDCVGSIVVLRGQPAIPRIRFSPGPSRVSDPQFDRSLGLSFADRRAQEPPDCPHATKEQPRRRPGSEPAAGPRA